MKKAYYILAITLLSFGCSKEYGDKNIDTGVKLFLDGNLEMAKIELTNGLTKDLNRYSRNEVLTILGNVYNDLSQYDSAIIYHKQSLDIDSNYTEAWTNLGIVYRLSGDYTEAEKCYNKAIAIDSSFAEAIVSLGALYVVQEKPDTAIQFFEKAIMFNKKLDVAYANYALALAIKGNIREAKAKLMMANNNGYRNDKIIKSKINEWDNFHKAEKIKKDSIINSSK